MAQTTILEEQFDEFSSETGEVKKSYKHTVKKNRLQPTDEFIKVSKYLNVIFAYNDIPVNLVPISLLFAQKMEYKTNYLYLLKADKEEMAQMLDVSLKRVESLIQECKAHDIIRPVSRGKYIVNSYLFSTGTITETRQLQALFDFDTDTYIATAIQHNTITKETIRKSVINKENKEKGLIQGQLSLDL